MKINELIYNFEVFTTNEEKELLNNLDSIVSIDTLTPREQVVIENLVKKSLVSKVVHNNLTMVIKNVRL